MLTISMIVDFSMSFWPFAMLNRPSGSMRPGRVEISKDRKFTNIHFCLFSGLKILSIT